MIEKEIKVPIIQKIGEDQEGNEEFEVLVYNRGLQTLAIGVNKQEAELVKEKHIKSQLKKSISKTTD